MTLREILEHRRAVRKYDSQQKLDDERVRECLRLATLAPTSSNLQLWEAWHVTSEDTLKALATACLGQGSARSAQQIVVFVTRQDKYRKHAREVLKANIDEVNMNSPEKKKAHRIALQKAYYEKLVPFEYSRFFGLFGILRKLFMQSAGLFRPITRQVTEADVRVSVHKSCALAAQTFMLAMSEQGYDTCPLEGFDGRLVKKALGLPYDCGINMVITCGVRVPEGVRGERYRLPFSEFYHQI